MQLPKLSNIEQVILIHHDLFINNYQTKKGNARPIKIHKKLNSETLLFKKVSGAV